MVEDPKLVSGDDLYPCAETVGVVVGIRMKHAVVDQNPRGGIQYVRGKRHASGVLSIAAVGSMAIVKRPSIASI